MHGNSEALALRAEDVLLRNTAVLENQLIGRGSADTHLLLLRSEGKARCSLFHDECGDFFLLSAAFLNGSRYRDDNVDIRFLAVCNEALGAVQNPLVSVKDRLCLLSLRICSGAGLGQTEGTEPLTFCELRNIFLLLLLGTEGHDRVDAQRSMSRKSNRSRSADLCDLLQTEYIRQLIAALSAVLSGSGNSHKAVFCELVKCLARKSLFLIDLLRKRLYFILREISEKRSRHFMFFI